MEFRPRPFSLSNWESSVLIEKLGLDWNCNSGSPAAWHKIESVHCHLSQDTSHTELLSALSNTCRPLCLVCIFDVSLSLNAFLVKEKNKDKIPRYQGRGFTTWKEMQLKPFIFFTWGLEPFPACTGQEGKATSWTVYKSITPSSKTVAHFDMSFWESPIHLT